MSDTKKKNKKRTVTYNSLTSPELIAQVNSNNKRLMEDFLAYCASTGISEGTVKQYDHDLDIFFVWVLQHADNKDFVKITKRDFVAFQSWLINTNKNSSARVRRLKSCISSLSNYVENVLDDEEGYAGYHSIIRKIPSPPKAPKQEKTVWTQEELDHLLQSLVEMGEYKKACFVALGIYSGRRKAELTIYRVCDFDDENLLCNGALYRTKDKIKTKGRGTGKYMYCYTLAKPFKPYFDMWMQERERLGIHSDWLFPDANNPEEPLKISTINSWTDLFSRITGKEFYMHSLRHACVSNLSRAGLPDNAIQMFIGWDSADMVNVYKDIDENEVLGMYFDENGNIKSDATKGFSEL